MCPFEFTATPAASPRYKSGGSFNRFGTESNGICGTVTAVAASNWILGTVGCCAPVASAHSNDISPTKHVCEKCLLITPPALGLTRSNKAKRYFPRQAVSGFPSRRHLISSYACPRKRTSADEYSPSVVSS